MPVGKEKDITEKTLENCDDVFADIVNAVVFGGREIVRPEELIDAVCKAGFKTIRIPVSWHNHVDENNQIDSNWLARVREVTDWVLEEGMFAIVNIHHDNYPESTVRPDRKNDMRYELPSSGRYPNPCHRD